MRLTNAIVKSAEAKEKKYSMTDGNGLQLTIKPDGKKVWEIRYTHNSKANTTTLGIYPTISLKDARMKGEEFRRKLYNGINPVEERRKVKMELLQKQQANIKRTVTFEKVARDFVASIDDEHSYKYLSIKIGRLENHVFPYIGHKPITDITRINVIECLDKLTENGKVETAERILSSISQIYKYAVTREITDRNITFEIDKRYVIGKKEVKHFAAITEPERVGELMRSGMTPIL